MARKNKKRGAGNEGQPISGGGSNRISTDISEAENGFVVSISGETDGKKPTYYSKRFIAHSRPEAMRIAGTHFAGAMKGHGKKGGKKKATTKR